MADLQEDFFLVVKHEPNSDAKVESLASQGSTSSGTRAKTRALCHS
jgi:hypothetical protein